jgi:hypothetical protein
LTEEEDLVTLLLNHGLENQLSSKWITRMVDRVLEIHKHLLVNLSRVFVSKLSGRTFQITDGFSGVDPIKVL